MSCNLTPAEVRALKREISSSLHCALPGIVESFDASGRTPAVRPAVRARAGKPVLPAGDRRTGDEGSGKREPDGAYGSIDGQDGMRKRRLCGGDG